MFLAALATTPAILIESTSKVSDLALYVMPRFLDAIGKFLNRRHLLLNIPYIQEILFSISLSCITHSIATESAFIKPIQRKLFTAFFGVN